MADASRQFEFCLPDRSTDDVLRERLAEVVEVANSTQGEERANAYREVQRLRVLLERQGAK